MSSEELRRVIVAGGTSGIGLQTAKMLAQKNYEVIILGRNQDKINQALVEVGQNVTGKSVDATNAAALSETLNEIGGFDHLVLAVSGGKGMGEFRTLDLDGLREGFEAKFFPQILTAQKSLPLMNPNGSITFITAISSRSRGVGVTGLGAINGAIEAMIPGLAKELKPLRINAVAPGVTDTAWWDFMPAEQKEAAFNNFSETIPLGRVGEAKEVAAMIVSLIENSYVTGQIISVDGGLSQV